MKKRILAMLLALVMCLGMLPTAALAEDVTFKIDDKGTLVKYNGSGGHVVIPAGVTTIGKEAFNGCTGLTAVTIPDGVTGISVRAFNNCRHLTSVTMADSVKSIGTEAFCGCTSLKEVTFSSNLTSIGTQAFEATALTTLAMPDSVVTCGSRAFAMCHDLASVKLSNNLSTLVESFVGCTALTSVTIPGSLKMIGMDAFRHSGLKEVAISEGVERISYDAFQQCEDLAVVTIPVSVKSILQGAFNGCTSLTQVHYAGTQEQWNAIEIGKDNDALNAASIRCLTPAPSQGDPPTAHASAQTVKVDGKPVEFQMYALKDANGNDTNYIKLRDLACVLDGTGAQFNLDYDQQAGTINVVTSRHYEKNGTEMTDAFGGADMEYVRSILSIKLNGNSAQLEAITLTDAAGGGYNYCKLRDLGQLLNFNVKWHNGVVIETDKPYTGK